MQGETIIANIIDRVHPKGAVGLDVVLFWQPSPKFDSSHPQKIKKDLAGELLK